MTHTGQPGNVRSSTRIRPGSAIVVALTFVILAWVVVAFLRSTRIDSPPVPDEKAAAAALLAQKLTGQGYFQSPAAAANAGEEEPRITVTKAREQLGRVATERGFDDRHVAMVRDLIDRLAEPAESRMVGETTINLLRLNLALDELR